MIPDFLSAWENPSTRHAMLLHFPVVLANLAVPLAILAALLAGRKQKLWHALTLLLLLGFTISTFMTIKAGHAAEGNLGDVIAVIGAKVQEHEAAAANLQYFGLAVVVLALTAFVPKKKIRLAGSWLTVLGTFVILWRIGIAAHLGGSLVYEYGAGTPNPLTQAQFDLKTGITTQALDNDPRLTFFRTRIKPILEEQCFGCHGPNPKNGFSLVTFRGIQTTGKHQPIVVPGDADASFLLEAIAWTGEIKMPKGDPKLPDNVIMDFRQWINEGAVWE